MTAMNILLNPWSLLTLGVVGFLFFGYLSRKEKG
jgi:hypothetical protein